MGCDSLDWNCESSFGVYTIVLKNQAIRRSEYEEELEDYELDAHLTPGGLRCQK